ncbi:taurine ABC transporter substrate-binding protein [Jannaschia rubra]|uniref:Sulfate starvation-induced protein 1 n=1 Tax=Jannaschia rubra TaxID=282197 RepID=A0A0M6XW49_9RHOB|nr:ABC transporter substrate-binding protein [Jannaschia rubra]CTQ34164.1 Sulfate starvation-induced protein 1 [Jannaschia rubra]SFG21693.1 taurine transport system substrate-binding protein [Jannaschia rubra]
MSLTSKLMGAAAAVALLTGAQGALAKSREITVAYFKDWPLPFPVAKNAGPSEDELGVDVNRVAFDTGTAMSAGMASGDVQISVSQDVPPFGVATSAGQDIKKLDVAVSYSDNDNCVVASKLEIDEETAKDLDGNKVSVPIVTAAHYGFFAQMAHFGVEVSVMEVVGMTPPDGASAFVRGALDMVRGYGGSLGRMKEHGNVLLIGDETDDLGVLVFDGTSAPASFVAERPDLLAEFLSVPTDATARWNSGPEAQAEMLPIMATESGPASAD